MKFHLIMSDEVDLGILHDTLLHLMTEHPPLEMKITVEFDSPSFDTSETPEAPNGASTPNDSNDHEENTEPQEPLQAEE